MASTLTYASLITDVPLYCEKLTDATFAAQLPRILMYAENRIATDLKNLGINIIVTGTTPTGSPTLPKPTYWRDTRSLIITNPATGALIALLPRSYTFCRTFWPNVASFGVPRYYADYGFDHFLLAPTPGTAYPFELSYEARQQPLDTTQQTNWLTVNAPQLLLQAVMVESNIFLKNMPKLQMWQGMYDSTLQALDKEGALRSSDASVTPMP